MLVGPVDIAVTLTGAPMGAVIEMWKHNQIRLLNIIDDVNFFLATALSQLYSIYTNLLHALSQTESEWLVHYQQLSEQLQGSHMW